MNIHIEENPNKKANAKREKTENTTYQKTKK